MSTKILRMIFPEWQGGANPNYYFGSKLLVQLAPKGGTYEKDVSEVCEIVGVGITEFIPWDEIRLYKAMEQISIFSE